MTQRYITEMMVIETLENGTIIEQPHGNDLYEHEIYEEFLEIMITVRVVVDEKTQTIVSVIDDTEQDSSN